MAYHYLLGGIPKTTSEENIIDYLDIKLNVKGIDNLWVDPLHDSQTVFSCSKKLDIKEIKNVIETTPFKNKIPFVRVEKETDVLDVKVPNIECKGLIDKLPWLFHQRKNGGSKVSDIKLVNENHFRLTMKDGWDAVSAVLDREWYIGDIAIKVAPFFDSFRNEQKDEENNLSNNKPSVKLNNQNPGQKSKLKKPTKDHVKPKTKDLYMFSPAQCILLDCLSLKAKIEEKYPNVEVTIDSSDAKISLKGVKVNEIESMITKQLPVVQDNWKEEFDLLLSTDCEQDLLKLFQHCETMIHLEEDPKRSIKLWVILRDQENLSLEEFLSSKFCVSENFTYTTPVPAKEKDILDYVAQFNEKYFEFKLQPKGENTLKLFYHGVLVDDTKKSSIIKSIQSFLKDKTEIQRNEVKTINKKMNNNPVPQNTKLGTSTKKLVLETQTPVSVTQTPVPVTQTYAPVTQTPVPVTQTHVPVTQTPVPVTQTHVPVTQTPVPVTQTHVPVTQTPVPVTQTHVPVTKTPLPVTQTPVPVTQTPVPVTQTPVPVTQTHVPVTQTPVPVTKTPLPVTQTPVPVTQKPAPPWTMPKPKNENVIVQSQLLKLLGCLSLKEKILETCSVKVEFKENIGLISLKGKAEDVTNLKAMLLSMSKIFDSRNGCNDVFEMFLTHDKNRGLVNKNFELHLEDFKVYIQDKNNKKGTFEDFTTKVLDQVDVFSLSDTPFDENELNDFLNNFNDKQYSFQLIENVHHWNLFRLSYDGDDEIVRSIYSSLKDGKARKSGNSHSKEESDDDGNDKYEDARESLPSDNTNDEYGHQTKGNASKISPGSCETEHKQNKPPIDKNIFNLTKEQAVYFKSNRMLSIMKKQFEYLDIEVNGENLTVTLRNESKRPKMFNDVKNYLSAIKLEKIKLSNPGVNEFFCTEEGQSLFSRIGGQHKCMISSGIKERSSSGGNEEEIHYKAILLSTVKMGNSNVFFHIVQGDSRNVHAKASLHICQAEPGCPRDGSIKDKNHGNVYLPPWFVNTETYKNRIEKERKCKDSINTALSQFKNSMEQNISISVSAKFDSPHPNDILSCAIIDQANEVFGQSSHPIHIFLCEAKSLSLLKAFQYHLTKSTNFTPPGDDVWNTLTYLVTSQKRCSEYPDAVKIHVSSSFSQTDVEQGKRALICYPMESPLDANTCPLKGEIHYSPELRYKNAIRELEKKKHDGLAGGEVFVFDISPLSHCDVALYGCHQWGFDVKKAIYQTLENCMKAGREGYFDSLFIMVPGTTWPWNYPKNWLISKWFQNLDELIEKQKTNYNKFKGTINFVIPDTSYLRLSEEYLNRRTKGGISWKNVKGWFSSDNSKSKSNIENMEVAVITHGKSVSKKVQDDIQLKMKNLMKDNKWEINLDQNEHSKALKIRDNLNTVECSYSKKKKKPVLYRWTIRGLTKYMVKNATSQLKGVKPKESSVDGPAYKQGKTWPMGSSKNAHIDNGGEVESEEESMETQAKIIADRQNSIDEEGSERNEESGGEEDDEENETDDAAEEENESPMETDAEVDDSWEKVEKEGVGMVEEEIQSKQNESEEKNKDVEETTKKQLPEMDNKRKETEISKKEKNQNIETEKVMKHDDEETVVKTFDDSNSNNSLLKNQNEPYRGKANVGTEEPHVKTIEENDTAASFLPPVDNFEWAYHDRNNDVVFFEEDESDCLEKAYRDGKDKYKVASMIVEFSIMIARSIDDQLKMFGVYRRELLHDKRVKQPDHWTREKLEKLKKSDVLYKEIQESLDNQFPDFHILKIERIQNQRLYGRFKVKETCITGSSNEKPMWQRIDNDFKTAVMESGCEKSLFKLQCAELGDGICFGSSLQYCLTEEDVKRENKVMLVRCLVSLGAEGRGKVGMRYPPLDNSTNKPFSSVSNDEFSMIFSSAQAYPTHFVHVRANNDNEC